MEKEIGCEQIQKGIIASCEEYKSHLDSYLKGDSPKIGEFVGAGNRLNYYFEELKKANSESPRIEQRMFLHEVGNLLYTLYTIPNFLSEMGQDEDLESAFRDNAGISLKQIKDLSGLITSDLSNTQKILENSSKFEARSLLEDAIAYTLPVTSNMNVKFNVSYPERNLQLYSDKSILLAAISTLIGNSLKYTRLDKSNSSEIEIDLKEDPKYLVLTIENPYDHLKTVPNVALGQNLGMGTTYLDQISLAFEGTSITRKTERGEKFVCQLKIPKKYIDEKIISRYQRMKEHKSKKSLENIASQ